MHSIWEGWFVSGGFGRRDEEGRDWVVGGCLVRGVVKKLEDFDDVT